MLGQLTKVLMAFLREAGRSVTLYGEMWFAAPEVSHETSSGSDPAADHPEKLRRDVPLSQVERALERQIRDLK